MFEEKELDELYDEFLNLDGDMFLESDLEKLDNDVLGSGRNVDASARKIGCNLNNNFLDDESDIINKPNVSIQLDLLNQNFVSLNTCDLEGKTKSPTPGGVRPTLFLDKKLDEVDNELKEIDEKLTSPTSPMDNNSFHRVGWASDTLGLWHSGPSSLNLSQSSQKAAQYQDLSSSVTYMSHGAQPFTGFSSSTKRTYSHQQLGAKVEMVYSLLSMLDTDNREDMSKTFLAMSSSPESCHAMRQSGCLPLLIQLIYSAELDKEVRNRAAEALHNIVHAQTDEKRRKREVRVLKLLQQVREYCDELKSSSPQVQLPESDKHPINATGTLMKLSFDAEHRQAICILGGLHAITDLIQIDHKVHGSTNNDALCITLRRYAGMSLTNLTFGDGKNKALLCSFTKFLLALVDQLKSPSEDLRQVTASVLRNLSWRADSDSKQALRNVGAVTALTVSAMEAKKESTLKSILSALWNLSAHCSLNKIDICSVPGALAFLVKMLKYKSASNTLSIIENAGGILRNISSHIAVREDYRQILRDNYCFEVLLEQLKSPSLTIVSNACGTLWNLSARCAEDQRRLWEMGATSMLRSLVQSKHKMISMGSSAALKNLLAANPNENLLTHLDSTAKSLGLQNLPTLFVRKKKALEQELNITLAETCDNIEPPASSSQTPDLESKKENKNTPKRSDSHDSVRSSQSDTVYELLHQMANEEKVLDNSNVTLHDSLDGKRRTEDNKLLKRYTTSMIPTPTSKKINQDRINEKTREEKLRACEIPTETDMKEHTRSDSKERNRKSIPVLKAKPKKSSQYDVPVGHNTRNSYSEEEETDALGRNDSFNECQVPNKVNDCVEQTDAEGIHRENKIEMMNASSLPVQGRQLPTKNSHPVESKNSVEYDKNCNVRSDKAGIMFNEHEPSENYTGSALSAKELSDDEKNMAINSSKVKNCAGHESESCEENIPKDLSQHRAFEELGAKSNPEADTETFYSSKGVIPNSVALYDSLEVEQSNQKPGCHPHQGVQEIIPEVKNSSIVMCTFDGSSNEGKNSNRSDTPDRSNLDDTGFFSGDDSVKNETKDSIDSPLLPPNKRGTTDSGTFTKTLSAATILPKFKVGSPITDRKALQIEARKICSEIQKNNDFEMGCSLTSEVSMVSCSSFLDTGDYSLFDCSTDAVNFDESELTKTMSKIKNYSFPKLVADSANSLPSLGSLKNDQIDALDLDNSVLSVASITSEINDNYTDEPVYPGARTYEIPEDTSGDATLVSKGDDTLNADILDDDCSLRSEDNLPLDTETFQQEVPERGRSRMTPKERRRTFHERYRTYTIRDFNGCAKTRGAGDQGESDDQTIEAKTQVGVYSTDPELNKDYLDDITLTQDLPSVTLCREPHHFSKSLDKETGCVSGFAFDSRSLSDLLSIGPSERKELVDNAKMVAFSLKTAVHDWETEFISDSEAEEPPKSCDIDTATYTKHLKDRVHARLSAQEDIQNVEDTPTEQPERIGAKVCIPTNKPEEEPEESAKGIRGRRKPLYSSPKKNLKTKDSSPAAIETKKQICQSPVLNREGTFTKENSSVLKKTEGKVTGAIPVPNRSVENPGRCIPRNKSLPSNGSPKIVGENRVSRIGRPLSTNISRGSERKNDGDSSQRRPYSAGAGNRTGGEGTLIPKKAASTCIPVQKMRNSSSSQNVRAGSSPAGKARNANLQSGKSQSDASLNLVDSKDKVGAGKPAKPGKREVTSKIASLWRKVEETKEKNKNVKDNRVWIGGEKNGASNETLVMEKEEIVHIPTRTIVHSYTCHALTDDGDDVTYQKRNSRNSGIPYNDNTEERQDRVQKRNVISAVVTPYNYNPPVSAVNPSNYKQVDNYQKNSLKVTTV